MVVECYGVKERAGLSSLARRPSPRAAAVTCKLDVISCGGAGSDQPSDGPPDTCSMSDWSRLCPCPAMKGQQCAGPSSAVYTEHFHFNHPILLKRRNV